MSPISPGTAHASLTLSRLNPREPWSPPQYRRRPDVLATPAPIQAHQDIRLALLFNLAEGIEPRRLVSTSRSPFPRHGHRAPAKPATASCLPRPFRPSQRAPGNLLHLPDLIPLLLSSLEHPPDGDPAVFPADAVVHAVSGDLPVAALPPATSRTAGASVSSAPGTISIRRARARVPASQLRLQH